MGTALASLWKKGGVLHSERPTLPPPYYHVIAGLTRNPLFIRNTLSLTGIIHTVRLARDKE
ncbi:MAG: hypothetical protein ACRCY6_05240 [Bacteroidales bacterium]